MGDADCSWYDVGCWLGWLQEELKQLVLWVYDAVLSGIVGLMDMIPVPDFLIDLEPITLPAGVAWAAEPFQIVFGVGICVSAYVARFILRRIPIIG
jgi:hypothetical protein